VSSPLSLLLFLGLSLSLVFSLFSTSIGVWDIQLTGELILLDTLGFFLCVGRIVL